MIMMTDMNSEGTKSITWRVTKNQTLAVFILEDADTASTAMYNLKSSLHVTVCRSDLAKKTFS